jgi:hypothetical protein
LRAPEFKKVEVKPGLLLVEFKDGWLTWVQRGTLLQSVVGDGVPWDFENLVLVAKHDEMLHVRVFDVSGECLADLDGRCAKEIEMQLQDLKEKLEDLWPPRVLTESESAEVIAAVTSVTGCRMASEICLELRSHGVADFNTGATHNYQVRVTQSEMIKMLDVLAEAAVADPARFEEAFAQSLKALVQLQAVVAGVMT